MGDAKTRILELKEELEAALARESAALERCHYDDLNGEAIMLIRDICSRVGREAAFADDCVMLVAGDLVREREKSAHLEAENAKLRALCEKYAADTRAACDRMEHVLVDDGASPRSRSEADEGQ